MLRRLRRSTARFARETEGSYSVEAVLILPVLLWAVLASLTFVDGYRQQTTNLRTTYTLADMLSRQSDPVGPRFVDGLGRIHEFLTRSRNDTTLRVTVAYWDADAAEHRLVWSDSSEGGPPPLTGQTLSDLASVIPDLADGASAIIVETWMDYVPAFPVGLGDDRFYHRVISTPRFGPQLKYDPDE